MPYPPTSPSPIEDKQTAPEPFPAPEGVPAYGASRPAISPDGATLAFSLGGEIWTAAAAGGLATRRTSHPAYDTAPAFSPGGRRLAFTSNRENGYEAYTLALDGGAPQRLTIDPATDIVCAWRDAGVVVESWRSTRPESWVVPLDGSTPQRIPSLEPADPTLGIADWRGTPNLCRLRPGDPPSPLTRFEGPGAGVRSFAVAPDGRVAVVEAGFHLHRVGLSSGEVTLLPIRVPAEAFPDPTVIRAATTGSETPDVSPDGRRVLFILGDAIWEVPLAGGRAKLVLHDPEGTLHWPRYCPDGSGRIAYFRRHAPGDTDVFILDRATGGRTRITDRAGYDAFQDWSPDGQTLAWSSDRAGSKDIWIVDLDDLAHPRQLTDDPTIQDDPAFTPDGERLLFDSGERGTQAIWIMDRDGGHRRCLWESALPHWVPVPSPDGREIVFETHARIAGTTPIATWSIRLDEPQAPPLELLAHGSTPRFIPGTRELVFVRNDHGQDAYEAQVNHARLFRLDLDDPAGTVREIPYEAVTERPRSVDHRLRLLRVWRTVRNRFYDPAMRGLDWEAVRGAYVPAAEAARTPEGFRRVVTLMLRELGVSHLQYLAPTRNEPACSDRGYLGCRLAVAPEGSIRLTDVEPYGPVAEAGLAAGDALLAIDGEPLGRGANAFALLRHKAGTSTSLTIQRGEEPPRSVTVYPLSAPDARALEYANTIAANVEQVQALAGGRVGYLHLQRMDNEETARFFRALAAFRESGVEAFILDVRGNVGGATHQQVVAALTSRPVLREQRRESEREVPPAGWEGRIALLAGENTFSDAEILALAVQELGIGPVIGQRTPGVLLEAIVLALPDGTHLMVPVTGRTRLDGSPLEGVGITPDIPVDPGEPESRGTDPTLARAVAWLLDRLPNPSTSNSLRPHLLDLPYDPWAGLFVYPDGQGEVWVDPLR